MRLIFMGTPEFAVPSFRRLAGSSHDIAAVVTNPDRPVGRGRRLFPPAVKTAACELDIDVLQPASLTDARFADQLARLEADIFVVVAFSILPRQLLEVAPNGAVNLHPSLLPAYRGAAPIIWTIFNGETETGVTTFLLEDRVDAGDILLQRRVGIEPDETAGELEIRLRQIGAELLADTLDGLERGDITPRPQGAAGASRAPKVTKEDGRLTWSHPAVTVRNRIRGANPVPGAFTEWEGGTLKVHRARLCQSPLSGEPGVVLAADSRAGLVIAAGDGSLELTEVQPSGKSKMSGTAFLRGHPIAVGSRLGPVKP